MDAGIIFVFMLSVLFIVIILWNAINNIGDTGQNELREKFSEEYGIVPLPDSIRVYTENEAYPSNKYFFSTRTGFTVNRTDVRIFAEAITRLYGMIHPWNFKTGVWFPYILLI